MAIGQLRARARRESKAVGLRSYPFSNPITKPMMKVNDDHGRYWARRLTSVVTFEDVAPDLKMEASGVST